MQNTVLEGIDQRLQLHAAGADPLGERRARQCHAGTREDGLLAVQRKVVGVLGNEHLCEEPGSGQALVDDLRGRRRLHQALALGASPLATDVALDGEHARGVIELLADVLSEALERAAT